MRLKKLTLQGYKTFATRTEFVFDSDITAVVGPNGSGKSNIADAMRWVLGEQSYGMLRGRRTSDMIFAGSRSRPRAGMAQVLLTLDNSKGWLPIDYAEVEVGRRAYRSGENEYIINGQKVRLRDVSELLATSGLSERNYTIIGQGLIDAALSLRPGERRALFEEAAGINLYQSRKAESLRRLQETEHNLERVQDILLEIEPRLRSLKRQASRAQSYNETAGQLRQQLRTWYGYHWARAQTLYDGGLAAASRAESAWQACRQQQARLQARIDELRQRLASDRQHQGELTSQREELRDHLENARRQVAILQERQQSVGRLLRESDQELPRLGQQQETAQVELAAAIGELEAAQRQDDKSRAELDRFEAGASLGQAEIEAGQQQERELEAQIAANQGLLSQARGRLAQLEERLQSDQAEALLIEKEQLPELKERLASRQAAVAETEATAMSARQELDALRRERDRLTIAITGARSRFAARDSKLRQLRESVAAVAARLALLQRLRQGIPDLEEDDAYLGQLAGHITVPDEYRRAIGAALRERLTTQAVADGGTLWRLLAANSHEALSIVAMADIRPAAPVEPPADTAVIGWASDVVGSSREMRPLVELLLRPLLLVREAEAAYRLAADLPVGFSAATPAGLVVHAGGLVESAPPDDEFAPWGRENAWREAREQLQIGEQELLEAETEHDRLLASLKAQEERLAELWRNESDKEPLLRAAEAEVAEQRRQLHAAAVSQEHLESRLERRAGRTAALLERRPELLDEIAQRQVEEARLVAALDLVRNNLRYVPAAAVALQRQNLRQHVESAQTIVAGRQAVVDSRRATLNQLDDQVRRLTERQATLRLQLRQYQLATGHDQEERLQQQLDELDEQRRPQLALLDEMAEELTQLQQQANRLQEQARDLEAQFTQSRVDLAQREGQLESWRQRIEADLHLLSPGDYADHDDLYEIAAADITAALPSVPELPTGLQSTIGRERRRLLQMGGINMDAPAEFEATQERYEFLTRQVTDLEATDRQLRSVIEELDELTSRAFGETVNKVNDLFGETFKLLFGGGAARLVLTDPDDLTVSGVDIEARLPHQREQGLALLSGGERSLTACALIFALLRVAPTPFCLMDEVDAALDEANTERFRELLQQLSFRTQFVLITHNRGSVQAADTVYGISMGSDSVSQAISIRPEDYLQRA